VGKVAPDFSLQILDSGGKLRRVTRDELKGKVVILDFWATWCGPCLAELPEIQALAENLSRKKGCPVAIVAVSEDRNEGRAVEKTRSLVEETLKARGIKLDFPGISSVAIDPEQEVGNEFSVVALPTLVVIDELGVVRSVRLGYQEGVKDELLKEVDRIVAGKRDEKGEK
jgi:thiol-disulfide isomerase/thioredoxin